MTENSIAGFTTEMECGWGCCGTSQARSGKIVIIWSLLKKSWCLLIDEYYLVSWMYLFLNVPSGMEITESYAVICYAHDQLPDWQFDQSQHIYNVFK